MYLGTRNQYKPPSSVLRGFLLCRFNIRQHPRDGGSSLVQSISSGKDLINFTRRTRQKDTPSLLYTYICIILLYYYYTTLYTLRPPPNPPADCKHYYYTRGLVVVSCIYLPFANYRVKLISFEVRVCPVDTRGVFFFFFLFTRENNARAPVSLLFTNIFT